MPNSNEYMAAYMLRRYHQRRNEAIQKLGSECADCGSTENLEIDHINPTEKKKFISRMWSVSKERFERELAKCQLLCDACHMKKTVQERGQQVVGDTHGTLSSYRYCKCEICRKAKSDHSKEYKKRKK